MSDISVEALKAVTPKSQRTMITEDLVGKLNEWDKDPKLMESFKTNVLSYISVLKEGKFKVTDYMNAVRFVSYKLMGYTDVDAYVITFPERYQRLIDEGVPRSEVSPYVSAYKNNALVAKIFEQTIVPTHVLNAPMQQEALNELMRLGLNARSEMARVNALSKVLDATKAPETAKIELDLKMDNKDAIAELRKATEDLAVEQLRSIQAGKAVKEIAESTIIEAEIE